MSRIFWSHHLTPSVDIAVEDLCFDVFEPPLVVPRTRSLPQPTRQLAELPDRRCYRSLSRTGVLLSAVGLPAREALQPILSADPYRAGIYCAIDAGPQNYQACKATLESWDDFASTFRKLNYPKRYFNQLINLPAAQLSIFLDLRGPVNVYAHSTAAVWQAFDQAEFDLAQGIVDAALICSAFSLEDPLLSQRIRQEAPDHQIVSEGAGALLLERTSEMTDWSKARTHGTQEACYGIANPLLDIIRSSAGPF